MLHVGQKLVFFFFTFGCSTSVANGLKVRWHLWLLGNIHSHPLLQAVTIVTITYYTVTTATITTIVHFGGKMVIQINKQTNEHLLLRNKLIWRLYYT